MIEHTMNEISSADTALLEEEAFSKGCMSSTANCMLSPTVICGMKRMRWKWCRRHHAGPGSSEKAKGRALLHTLADPDHH